MPAHPSTVETLPHPLRVSREAAWPWALQKALSLAIDLWAILLVPVVLGPVLAGRMGAATAFLVALGPLVAGLVGSRTLRRQWHGALPQRVREADPLVCLRERGPDVVVSCIRLVAVAAAAVLALRLADSHGATIATLVVLGAAIALLSLDRLARVLRGRRLDRVPMALCSGLEALAGGSVLALSWTAPGDHSLVPVVATALLAGLLITVVPGKLLRLGRA